MIRSYRSFHFIYIDASDAKDIDEWFEHRAFSIELPQCHKKKHINWKETYSILYALSKWTHLFKDNAIIFIYDNEPIIDALNKYTTREKVIYILQFIYLIITLYDIKLSTNWLSFEENWIVDALSRFNLLKLVNYKLNEIFQISLRESNEFIHFLYKRLIIFFKMNSLNLQDLFMISFEQNSRNM